MKKTIKEKDKKTIEEFSKKLKDYNEAQDKVINSEFENYKQKFNDFLDKWGDLHSFETKHKEVLKKYNLDQK